MTIDNVAFDYEPGDKMAFILYCRFTSSRQYKCYMSGDEVIVVADSDIIMNGSKIYNDDVSKEVEWCEEHFIELREIYFE